MATLPIMSYTTQGCTVADGDALAENNMRAFATDPTWILLWNIPLDEIVASCKKRMPWNMLRNRETHRHIKAVNADGNLVGYARWILPESKKGSWLCGTVPGVGKEETMRLMEMHRSAEWNLRRDMDVLDYPVHARVRELKKGKEYISTRIFFPIA
jgi:hypothetical protein